MDFWASVKALGFKKLLRFAKLFSSQPNYLLLTARATKKAMQIATEIYGKTHHRNNRANAFRHALWANLIAKGAFRKSKDLKRSIKWAKQVTDLYEDISINPPLERAMDLHNNSQGIQLLDRFPNMTDDEIVEILKNMAQDAVKIKTKRQAIAFSDRLVYLTE